MISVYPNVICQAQPHDTGEQLITQSAPMARRNYAMGRRPRPVCASCNKDFGRVQELKRHLKDVHMPRCRCPFCNYTWTRPNKIKAHLMADHIDKFTAEMLDGIKDLYGQRIIEFVNAYHSGPHIEVTYAIPGTGQVPFDPTQLCSTGAFPSGADHVLRHPETPQPPMSWHLATPSTHQELVPFLREPHVDPPHHFLESCSPHYDMIYYV